VVVQSAGEMGDRRVRRPIPRSASEAPHTEPEGSARDASAELAPSVSEQPRGEVGVSLPSTPEELLKLLSDPNSAIGSVVASNKLADEVLAAALGDAKACTAEWKAADPTVAGHVVLVFDHHSNIEL